jgi:serine protease Do
MREQIAREAANKMLDVTIAPSTTQPAPPTTTQQAAAAAEAKGFRLVPRGDGSFDLVGGAGGDDRAILDVAPRSAGFVLDSHGHVLVPYFVEPETVGQEPLSVMCGDGTVVSAKYVGSDPATMITVLKLERPMGTPMRLDGRRPSDGSLVFFLSSTGESARLQVWTGVQMETGVVMAIDGSVRGFLRQGQFLDAASVRPVIEQILTVGHAKRQRVGVWIREILPADPLRREIPILRDRPAVFVAQVVPNTPADRAGFRKGDLILGIGDENVGDPPTFAAAITPFQGRTAPFRVLRDGREMELAVELGKK